VIGDAGHYLFFETLRGQIVFHLKFESLWYFVWFKRIGRRNK
jgi:hypothetical protein